MARRTDRERRATGVAGAILAALFLSVVAANLLWPGVPSADPNQPRLPPTASPFPTFRIGAVLHVAPMDVDANLSTRLLMTSLQGIANRREVQLYLDTRAVAGNTSAMLVFIAARYNVTYDTLSTAEAIDRFAPQVAGLVVYDPSRPESIDIGTMMASQRDAALVGPDLAGWLRNRFGLPILFDYASSDWARLDAIGAYDRALRDLYPSSSTTLLSILPPDRWAIRDYLIATRTFVFSLPQGALASPFESAATMRILHATPRGIPILGWFSSPTLTEENSFVQMASHEGKFVIGVQDMPNLSVLTALGRNATHRQVSSSPIGPSALENKTYVVLAVPDGDNLDFAAGRMRDLWDESIRSTVPFAWSLNPLLVDLAPPLVDMYYDEASPLDRFIAAPSGAGYLYPDYLGPGDLPSFVAFSKRYLDAADMDVVWLLNAFTASEIPYTPASLAAYVDGLRPEGIVLDYDDQPRTRDLWMGAGAQVVAPIVRSTHFWTTADNVLGKLDAAAATWGDGPHFLWLTIYTFRFDLTDGLTVVQSLASRLNQDVEIVTPTRFFALLRQDFVQSANARLAATESDPLASVLAGGAVDSARARLAEADAYLAAADPDRAANAAYLGLEDLRSVSSTEALVVSLFVVLVGAILAILAVRSSGRSASVPESFRPATLLIVTAAVALLLFALREALEQNFWTYPTILIGIAVAGVHRPLRRFLDLGYPDRAPVAAALIALVFTALAIRTSVAFPLSLIGSLLAIDAGLSRRPGSSGEIVAGLAFGTAVGLFGGFDLVTFAGLAVVLVVSALGLRGPPSIDSSERRPRPLLAGFVLALPLAVLAVAFYYTMALRLQIQGEFLATFAGTLVVLGPTLAVLVRRALRRVSAETAETAGFALAVVSGGLVLASRGTVPTGLALLGLASALSYASLAELDRFAARGGEPRRALATAALFVPLFVLFFRMPPIVYSLTLVRLPEMLEYALYEPTVLIAAIALGLAGFLGVRARLRAA